MAMRTATVSLRESVAAELADLKPAQLRKVRDFVRWLKWAPFVSKMDLDQAYFWTPEWQAKERAADQALEQGEVRTFDAVDDLVAFLEAQ